MREDYPFLVTLIKEVEKHEILYNFKNKGYHNTPLIDQHWNEISIKLDEPGFTTKRSLKLGTVPSLNKASAIISVVSVERAKRSEKRANKKLVASLLHEYDAAYSLSMEANNTIQQLRDKWKRIRSCYAREKRNSVHAAGSRYRRPYYLSSYLKFLDPYIAKRNSNASKTMLETYHVQSSDESSRVLPDDMSMDEKYDSGEDWEPTSDAVPSNVSTKMCLNTSQNVEQQHQNGKQQVNEMEECLIDGYPTARSASSGGDERSERDACELFLMSLAPEMREMTQKEQLMFRIGILKLIERIKFPNESMAALVRPSGQSSGAMHSDL